MSNGQVISEIRSIVASDEAVPAKTRDRLVLAAIAELYSKVEDFDKRLKEIEIERKNEKEKREKAQYYSRTAWGAVIVTAVMLAFNAILWFVKILPVLSNLGGG